MNEIQYSIYKLNKEKIIENNSNINEEMNGEDILETLMHNIYSSIRTPDFAHIAKKDEFICLVINSSRQPVWINAINSIMEIDKDELKNYKNVTISYILGIVVNNSIYVTTGGYGSAYLNKIKELGYGRSILPKITEATDANIKATSKTNIGSNAISVNQVLSKPSTPSEQIAYNTIVNRLNIEGKSELSEILGLGEDDKKISINSSDQIRINRRLSLEELRQLIIRLNELEETDDHFNYSILTSIKGIARKKELDMALYEEILHDIDKINIQLPPDYYTNNDISNHMLIWGEESEDYSNIIINEDVIDFMKKNIKKLTKTSICNFMKEAEYRILSDKLDLLEASSIEDLLSMDLEYNGKTFYKITGQWYVYDIKKYDFIKDEYHKFYDESEAIVNNNNIKAKFNLIKDDETCEDSYNNSFLNSENVIVGHKIMYKKAELADLIFYDDERLYLMCNKNYANGQGARDVLGQINLSESLIIGDKLAGYTMIKEYYDSLNNKKRINISKDEFIKLFNKKITFIAGFSENYKRTTTSVHIQAQLINTRSELRKNNCDLIAMNYTNIGFQKVEKDNPNKESK